VARRAGSIEQARQWAMTLYLIIVAASLARILAIVLAERYL
jgi:hypothetical protein